MLRRSKTARLLGAAVIAATVAALPAASADAAAQGAKRDVSVDLRTYSRGSGPELFEMLVVNAPRGSKLSITCRPQKLCRPWSTARTTRKATVFRAIAHKRLRKGMRIVVRVRRPDGTGRELTLKVTLEPPLLFDVVKRNLATGAKPGTGGTNDGGGGGTPNGGENQNGGNANGGSDPNGGGNQTGGGGGVQTPEPDRTAPDTEITGGPQGAMQGGSGKFTYRSTEPGTRFDCRLDAGAWAPCDGGATTLSFGSWDHTLAVRAVDAAGNADQSPATRTWSRYPDNGTEWVVDDVARNGPNWTSYGGGGSVGGSYWYFENYLACAGDPSRNWGQWTVNGLPNGAYDVYAYIPNNTPSRSGVVGNALAYNVHYWLQYREGVAETRPNQFAQGGNWVHVAKLGFNGTGVVRLYDDDVQNGTCFRKYIIADAVKWVYREVA